MSHRPQPPSAAEPLVSVAGLRVATRGEDAPAALVRGVSFAVDRGELVALVGESGCGKTLTALAMMRLLPAGLEVAAGSVTVAGVGDVVPLGERALGRVRGRRLAMTFQDAGASLNPVLTVGRQLTEVLAVHHGLRGKAARRRAVELLAQVAMPDPEARLRSYAHELSGGQQQRALIALALACGPDLLIADEPTTALDVTVQAQVIELFARLRAELGLAVLLITHDLGVVAELCDRVLVMYAGQIVEAAPVETLFAAPAHPYTRALLAARPRLGGTTPPAGIPGTVPEPGALPPGCAFAPRCPEALPACSEPPPMVTLGAGHRVRCVLHADRGEER